MLPCENVTGEKIALFTDTVHEINGVALTINKLIETATTGNRLNGYNLQQRKHLIKIEYILSNLPETLHYQNIPR